MKLSFTNQTLFVFIRFPTFLPQATLLNTQKYLEISFSVYLYLK